MNINNSSRQLPDPAIALQGLDQGFTSLDANRAAGYGALGQVRAAKSASLAREQKFLNIKHGTTDTPRAQYAAAALTQNEQFRRDVAASRETLEVNAPDVDANSFVLYGFVRRKNQAGVPGLTLALTDEQGTWIRRYGYACTDKRGYFELRIEGKPSTPTTDSTGKTPEQIAKEAELAKLEKERAAAAAGQTPETPASGNTQGSAPSSSGMRINTNQSTINNPGYQLRVFNREGRVLHVEQRTVTPRANTVDYRVIIIDDEDCGCTPPPEKSDGESKPSSPYTPPAPPPAPAQPAPSSTATPRVANLKSYENPVPVQPNQPLEAIRGIGPKTATKLRAAGIADVAAFEKTPGQKLVDVAGFDKVPPKPIRAKPSSTTKPPATPAKRASTASEGKKPTQKSVESTKPKRPKK